MSVPEHLGGFCSGPIGDPCTYYPELWAWLIRDCGVRSMLDVGCGEGHTVRFFREQGVRAFGIDGVPQQQVGTIVHDFTTGPYRMFEAFDICWSCEFVEHVEERYLPNYLPCFTAAPLVLMTHAFPGQLGHHHVQCRDAEYWRGVMAAIGYSEDGELTATTRALAEQDPSPLNHYARSGMAFRRNP